MEEKKTSNKLLEELMISETQRLFDEGVKDDDDFRKKLENLKIIMEIKEKSDKLEIEWGKLELEKSIHAIDGLRVTNEHKQARLNNIFRGIEVGTNLTRAAAATGGIIGSYRAEYRNGVITSGSTTLRKSENLIK